MNSLATLPMTLPLRPSKTNRTFDLVSTMRRWSAVNSLESSSGTDPDMKRLILLDDINVNAVGSDCDVIGKETGDVGNECPNLRVLRKAMSQIIPIR